MNPSIRAIALTSILSLACSCATNYTARPKDNILDESNASAQSLNCPRVIIEPYSLKDVPSRAGKIDWGLALSGGGIRSASYSIGVMKALYDIGILDSVDVISSVSGGGYASYWIFSNYLQHGGGIGRFGSTAFEDDDFVKNLCELQISGRFIPVSKQIKSLVYASTGRSKRSFTAYEDAIHRVYGNQADKQMTLSSATHLVGHDKAPFFIINTTVRTEDKISTCNLFDNTIELTPSYVGNPTFGFHPWSAQANTSVRWSESISMSGAAVKPLLHEIDFKTAQGQDETVQLSDGGHSENLAALSLITRNLKNIIIVDAEHDPDYIFEGYERLRHLLPSLGYDFSVPEIDRFLGNRNRHTLKDKKEGAKYKLLAQNVFIGYARQNSNNLNDAATGEISKIYYIKMSMPPALVSQLSDTAAIRKGAELSNKRNHQLEEFGCDSLISFPFDPSMFTYTVGRYNEHISKHFILNKFGKFKKAFRYSFPHTSTVDQSFYIDQLEAFVGLGFYQASELEKQIDR